MHIIPYSFNHISLHFNYLNLFIQLSGLLIQLLVNQIKLIKNFYPMKKKSIPQNKFTSSQDLSTDCQCSLFNRPPKNNQSFRFDPNKHKIQLEQIHRTNLSLDHKKKISVSSLTKRKSRENSLKNNQQNKDLMHQQLKQQKMMNTKPSIQFTVPQIQKINSYRDNRLNNQFSQFTSSKQIQKTMISTTYDHPRGIHSNQAIDSKIETFQSKNNFNPNFFPRNQKNHILFNYGIMTQSTDPQIFSGYDKIIPLKIPRLNTQMPQIVPEESTFRSNQQQKVQIEQNQKKLYLKETQSLYDQNEKNYPTKRREQISNLQMETQLHFKTIQSIHNSLQNSRNDRRSQVGIAQNKGKQVPFQFINRFSVSNFDNLQQNKEKLKFPEQKNDYSFF